MARSPPAENAVPSPRTTIARTSSSASASRQIPASSRCPTPSTALSLPGALMVTRSTPSRAQSIFSRWYASYPIVGHRPSRRGGQPRLLDRADLIPIRSAAGRRDEGLDEAGIVGLLGVPLHADSEPVTL